ncbi:MAG TPA: glycosyltransferase family 2 protein, partial [Patescibacteria group bacterium]
NTEDDTHEFLKSLTKIKPQNFNLTVVVVDNGSKNIFKRKDSEEIILIRSEKNLGFTGGYNLGMRKALEIGAEYIMIVNNDTIVEENLITYLQQELERDSKVGVTVPKIYFAKGHEFHKDRYKKEDLGKVLWYAGGYIDWDNVMSIHRGVDEVDHGQYDNPEPVSFATGCCLMIKREILKKVGFLDDQYFLYYEDADFNERVKRAGYTIVYVPKAVLYHVNASSSGGAGHGNALQDYFITRNQMVFGLKYAPLRTKMALIRQSVKLLFNGRREQKRAIKDFYMRKLGKGTFFNN